MSGARGCVLAAALACACAHGRAGERPLADLAAGRMIEVAGGTFLLGERTGPARDVVAWTRLDAFLLDATEVTVAAYAECAKAGRCAPAGDAVRARGVSRAERDAWAQACNRDRPDRADHPVNCVDRAEAEAFCAWAGKRLPTEEEWEWAARSGRAGTAWPWGDLGPADEVCWAGAPGGRTGTCAAGASARDAAASGVRDLAGNVREWTSTDTMAGADSRGRGGSAVAVVRGGSWGEADPHALTATRRAGEDAARRDPFTGFRCASAR